MILKSFFLFAVICISITSCKTDEIDVYNSKRALYFPKYNANDKTLAIDSTFISFSHYPGRDEMDVPFRISLIGPLLEEDMSYSISVVKDRTTASESDYSLPQNLIFRKGFADDTLWVKIKRANLGDEEKLLVLAIEENENFEIGFSKNISARLAFNNLKSQPLWWNKEIIASYFGTYSYEKYQTIITAAEGEGINFTSTAGLTPTEIREIALIAKDYIAANNIKEADGRDMIIIAY